jgi:hypothetical protein
MSGGPTKGQLRAMTAMTKASIEEARARNALAAAIASGDPKSSVRLVNSIYAFAEAKNAEKKRGESESERRSRIRAERLAAAAAASAAAAAAPTAPRVGLFPNTYETTTPPPKLNIPNNINTTTITAVGPSVPWAPPPRQVVPPPITVLEPVFRVGPASDATAPANGGAGGSASGSASGSRMGGGRMRRGGRKRTRRGKRGGRGTRRGV